jgi:general nucleoside transport system ATP-binding protein
MNGAVSPGSGTLAPDQAGETVVEMRGVTKRFGSLTANDSVDLALRGGEVHALLGENGAGKTTLMNMLFGLLRPDAGTIAIRGEEVALDSPRDALAHRVGMVHQHFMLVPDFTVAENVVLGTRSSWDPKLRRRGIETAVGEVAERFGMGVRADQPVGELSIDVQQRVEILKLLYAGADILILDEPTAVLGPVEIEALFATLRSLAEGGAAIVIITHKLREVTSIADRVTVLRHGAVVARSVRGELDEGSLAEAMLGHALPATPEGEPRQAGPPVLTAHGLSVAGDREETAVDDVDLELRGGEIVGLAGVEGNGQVELCQALCGLRDASAGTISLGDRDLTGSGTAGFADAGVGVISDDRLLWDVIPDFTLADNLALSKVRAGDYTRGGLLNRRAIQRDAAELLVAYDVRPPDPDALMSRLSGGNQQKVVIARECAAEPKALIASHPTRGLDVGATEFVHRRLVELRDQGCAVLLNSTDLDELLALCDRIVVLYRGRAVLSARSDGLAVRAVAEAMTGGGGGEAE